MFKRVKVLRKTLNMGVAGINRHIMESIMRIYYDVHTQKKVTVNMCVFKVLERAIIFGDSQ